MNGFERLRQMEKEENDLFISAIVDYLITRKDMEPKYLNEEKNLKSMLEFIQQKALALCIKEKKDLPNSSGKYSCVGLDNNRVYLWAIMYFSLDNDKLGMDKLKEKIGTAVTRVVPNITKQATNKTATPKTEINKKENEAQMSLFNL